MRQKEKEERILRWWDEGRIRKVGNSYKKKTEKGGQE